MSTTLIHPDNKNSKYIIMSDNFVNLFGCASRAMVCSVLIGLHDYFIKKYGDKNDGKFFQTHKQIKNRFPGIFSSQVITDAFKIAQKEGILTISKEKRSGQLVKNWFKVNVERVREILDAPTESLNQRLGESPNRCHKKVNITTKSKYKTIIIDNKAEPLNRKKPISKSKIILLKKKTKPNVDSKNIVHPKKVLKAKKSVVKSKISLAPKVNVVIKKKAPKPKDKIDKLKNMTSNPYVKNKRQAGYKYTLADGQLYRSLIELGATNHKADKEGNMSNSYYETMDSIHQILDHSLLNPYNGSNSVSEEFKNKKWTQEEIIAAFKYYMSIVDKSKILYKNIATFIFASYNGTRSWSPLTKFFTEMNQDNGESLEGDAKKFYSELERLHIADRFDYKDIKRILRLLDVICNDYVPNPAFKDMFFDSLVYTFMHYVENKLRSSASFKPEFIRGEKQIQEFFDDYVERRNLIHINETL